MIDLELKDLKISKTFTSDCFWFCVAERAFFVPKIEDVSIYCDIEEEIFEIKIVGTWGIALKSAEEAKKIADYLELKMWKYDGDDKIEVGI